MNEQILDDRRIRVRLHLSSFNSFLYTLELCKYLKLASMFRSTSPMLVRLAAAVAAAMVVVVVVAMEVTMEAAAAAIIQVHILNTCMFALSIPYSKLNSTSSYLGGGGGYGQQGGGGYGGGGGGW